MSKSFAAAVADIASDTPPTVAARKASAPVVEESSNLPAPIPSGDGGFSGEMDKSDLIIPRLAIVQKVGDLSEMFPGGTILINKRLVVAPFGQAVTLTIVRARKYFMEIRAYGDEIRPKVFETHKEVEAAGLTMEPKWKTGIDATAKPVLDCVVAIHGAAGNDTAPEFALVHEGKRYALALWSLSSPSAYNAAGKSLLSARQMYLKSFVEQSWNLTVSKAKFGSNSVFIPEVTPAALNSESLRAYFESIV